MKKAFTLIEVMIVIAIVGLIAAIAIPSFYKAKQIAEIKKLGYDASVASKIFEIITESASNGNRISIQEAVSRYQGQKDVPKEVSDLQINIKKVCEINGYGVYSIYDNGPHYFAVPLPKTNSVPLERP